MAVSMIILVILSGISCFNIDTDNVIHFKGKEGIHFGYTAELFTSSDGQKWVVVGAPKANFTTHPYITKPGNIYKCKLDFKQQTQSACEPLNLKNSDTFRFPTEPGYEEDNQLLGASMAVIDDKIVTCAPLWKNMIPIISSNIVYPIGRCSNIAKTLNTFTSVPFKKTYFSEYQPESEFTYEFAETGFSISNKKYVDTQFDTLLGTPGFYGNKGGFFQYNPLATTDPFFISFTPKAFSQQQSIEMGTLLGYSISTGKLEDGDPNCPAVVILGAPHFVTTNGIVGSVLVVCANYSSGKHMIIKKQFFGTKSGCGYGASLLFDDVNGDGMDDLLVGAPLQDNKPAFDVGSVYIYYGDDDPSEPLKESTNQKLRGSNKEFSRFGSALQCIGDINKDGYKDIVVAAPYEDDLKGAIYLYHGGSNNLIMTQRITAQNIGVDLYSFGWYISAANDIDNNQYPDFLVGSYMSDTVTLLRTRPIIRLSSTLHIDPLVIPLNSSGLQCQDSQFRPCVSIHLCFNYSGINVPDSIMVAYNVSSDTLRTNAVPSRQSRVQILIDGDQEGSENIVKQIIVNKNESTCVPFMRAVVLSVSREFFASLNEELVIETTYGLSNEPIPGDVQPVLNNAPTKLHANASFFTGCNATCHPDLSLEVSVDPTVIILRNISEIVLRCIVTNRGDMSYGTQITIRTSIKMEYLGFLQPQTIQSLATALVSCQGITDQNNQTFVQCDLKSTLFQQQKAIFEVRFLVMRSDLVKIGESLDTFDLNTVFTTKAESTSPDKDESDNTWIVQAKVKLQSNVEISGVSSPDQLKVSDKGDKTLSFVHKYYVLNHGPSPLNNGTLFICIPVKDSFGTMMIFKDDIKVITNSINLRWRLIKFADETFYNSSSEVAISSTSPSSMFSTTTLPTKSSVVPNRKRRETTDQLVQDQTAIAKKKFKDISCSTIEKDRQAIIELHIDLLEQDQTESFDLTVNISEKSLNFEKVSGILFTSTGEIESRNNNRYETIGTNATYDISSEIFPKEVSITAEKINIWIIIGGCIAGVVLLIVLGVILWKCGFFKRKKKDDIQKWKRQSGYYAKRQSTRAGNTKSSLVKNIDFD